METITPRLKGSIALIAGGAGEVGESIVRAFLREGATVVVPSRTAERLEQLRGYLAALTTDRLVPLVGHLGEPEEAERVRDEVLGRFGRLDAVVASLGSWWQGPPLVEVPLETWERIFQDNLTPHFVVARTFLPVLVRQGKGSYTLIGGGAAEMPIPLSGPICITAAAQLMMMRVLAEELKGSGVRINQVMLNNVVMTRARGGRGQPEWINEDQVGEFVASLASDEGAMVNGRLMPLGQRPSRTEGDKR